MGHIRIGRKGSGGVEPNAPITPSGVYSLVTYDDKGLVTDGRALDISDITFQIPASLIGGGTVDDTEFSFLDGLEENVQDALEQFWRADGNANYVAGSKILGNTTGAITITGKINNVDWLFLDTGTRELRDGSGATSLDFSGRIGLNSTGLQTIDYENGTLLSPSPNVVTVDWGNGNLKDTGSVTSLDWINRGLVNPLSSTLLDWVGTDLNVYTNIQMSSYEINANILRGNSLSNQFGQNLIDTGGFAYYDGSAFVAINMNSRQLIDTTGSTVSVDWGGRGLYDSGVILSFDWETRTLIDAVGNTSIQFDGRELYDASSVISIGYDARTLYDTTANASVSYGTRQLRDSGGSVVMNWASREVYSSISSTMLNWGNSTGVRISPALQIGRTSLNLAPTTTLHLDVGNATATTLKFTAGTTTGTTSTDGFDVGITTTGGAELRQRENQTLEIYQNNSLRMQFMTNGAVDCSGATQYRFGVGSAGVPSITFAAGVTDGFYRSGTNQISTAINGAERMRIDSAGKATIYQGTALRGAMATVYSQINSVGNVGAGEDNLHSVSVPSSGFAANGDSYEIKCSGTFAANANNKRVKLKFGAITLFDTTALAFNTGDWEINARIFRTTTTTGKSIVTWTCNNATLTTTCDYQAWAFNFLTSNTLVVTGEATADNDIVQELMQVFWVPVS